MKLRKFFQLQNIHVTITQTLIRKAYFRHLMDNTAHLPQDNTILCFDTICLFCLFELYISGIIWYISFVFFHSILRLWAPSRLWSMVVDCSSLSLYCILYMNISKFNHLYDRWWAFGHVYFFPVRSRGTVNFL